MRFCPMLNGAPLPWAVAEAIWEHLYNVLYPNYQSLERIAQRGGFGYDEIEYMAQQVRDRQSAAAQEVSDASDD